MNLCKLFRRRGMAAPIQRQGGTIRLTGKHFTSTHPALQNNKEASSAR